MAFSVGEQNLLDDANEFIRQTANLISDTPPVSGIRPNPVIDVTQTESSTVRFGTTFAPEPPF